MSHVECKTLVCIKNMTCPGITLRVMFIADTENGKDYFDFWFPESVRAEYVRLGRETRWLVFTRNKQLEVTVPYGDTTYLAMNTHGGSLVYSVYPIPVNRECTDTVVPVVLRTTNVYAGVVFGLEELETPPFDEGGEHGLRGARLTWTLPRTEDVTAEMLEFARTRQMIEADEHVITWCPLDDMLFLRNAKGYDVTGKAGVFADPPGPSQEEEDAALDGELAKRTPEELREQIKQLRIAIRAQADAAAKRAVEKAGEGDP